MLDVILAAHRRAAAADTRSVDELATRAAEGPDPRPFKKSLEVDGLAVIAEIKRRSPSAGALAPDVVVTEIAAQYESGGAAALSVLTDGEFFGGSPDDLAAARAACSLPVLRKDFTVSEADVYDARVMGADAVLLIVAALTDSELRRLREVAASLGMAALVEVHTAGELSRAVDAGCDLVGVNSRDLLTFEVDLGVFERLAELIPDGVVSVAESGIKTPADTRRVAECGYDAVLVGTGLITSADPAASIRRLMGGDHRE